MGPKIPRSTVLTPAEEAVVVAFRQKHDAGKLHPGFQAKDWPKGVWRQPTLRAEARYRWLGRKTLPTFTQAVEAPYPAL
jgi:hypothetical protein